MRFALCLFVLLIYLLLQVCLHWVWLCWWREHFAAPQQTEEGLETAGPTGTCVTCVHLSHGLPAEETASNEENGRKKKKKKRGWGSEDTCINSKNSFSQHEALTLSSFSIRANKEGISAVCSMPSSVVQAAKAGIKTWWTALTTRSDGSARESSISSKPCTCEGFEI